MPSLLCVPHFHISVYFSSAISFLKKSVGCFFDVSKSDRKEKIKMVARKDELLFCSHWFQTAFLAQQSISNLFISTTNFLPDAAKPNGLSVKHKQVYTELRFVVVV